MWGGTDRLGQVGLDRQLGLDQSLVDGFGGLTDTITNISDLECIQDFERCRFVVCFGDAKCVSTGRWWPSWVSGGRSVWRCWCA